jgi:hypothetical protein
MESQVVGSVPEALGRLSPERRRLNELVNVSVADAAPLVVPETLAENTDASLERAARWMQKSPKDMNRLRRRMGMAGYRSYEAALAYSILELVLPVIGFVAVIYFVGVSGGLAFAMLAAAVGYFGPSLWLSRRIEARKRKIRNGLPDALDLFIVCVESGSSLDQAISKAGEEFALAHPALAEELRVLATEIRAGKPRLDAFRDFGERTKVDDVRALVAMLVLGLEWRFAVPASNIGAIQIALKTGEVPLYKYQRLFGFGQKTGIELAGESGGNLRDVKQWMATSIGSLAMGHEVSVTSLQLAVAGAVPGKVGAQPAI